MTKPKILCVVGARPNFVKISAILHAFEPYHDDLDVVLVHTGQHYDHNLAGKFIETLDIPKPNYHLGIPQGTQTRQTAEVMLRIEKVLEVERPNILLVVGDVNSTLGASLVAAKMGIAIAHVESGLRSHDKSMPEEINRILTDQLATWHFTTEPSANENLKKEGFSKSIYYVGNVMIDTLIRSKKAIDTHAQVLNTLKVTPQNYSVLTLHRPSNVDSVKELQQIMKAVGETSGSYPVVFPCHPRTQVKLNQITLEPGIIVTKPLEYMDMLSLMAHAKLVMTDSGGIQEETTALGVPCLTLRENTERPITVSEGTNKVIGTKRQDIVDSALAIFAQKNAPQIKSIPLWDGMAAQRICRTLAQSLISNPQEQVVA